MAPSRAGTFTDDLWGSANRTTRTPPFCLLPVHCLLCCCRGTGLGLGVSSLATTASCLAAFSGILFYRGTSKLCRAPSRRCTPLRAAWLKGKTSHGTTTYHHLCCPCATTRLLPCTHTHLHRTPHSGVTGTCSLTPVLPMAHLRTLAASHGWHGSGAFLPPSHRRRERITTHCALLQHTLAGHASRGLLSVGICCSTTQEMKITRHFCYLLDSKSMAGAAWR